MKPRLFHGSIPPTDLLLRLARREVEGDDGDAVMPSLVALHRRPTREVFDRAAALAGDADATRRELGVRILRELGDEGTDGRRPFRDETVALLRARLGDETDPAVVRWIVSALGVHRGREALAEIVALAGHPDERVRFHVAVALPGLVDLDRVEPGAVAALVRLCHDDDADPLLRPLRRDPRDRRPGRSGRHPAGRTAGERPGRADPRDGRCPSRGDR